MVQQYSMPTSKSNGENEKCTVCEVRGSVADLEVGPLGHMDNHVHRQNTYDY